MQYWPQLQWSDTRELSRWLLPGCRSSWHPDWPAWDDVTPVHAQECSNPGTQAHCQNVNRVAHVHLSVHSTEDWKKAERERKNVQRLTHNVTVIKKISTSHVGKMPRTKMALVKGTAGYSYSGSEL